MIFNTAKDDNLSELKNSSKELHYAINDKAHEAGQKIRSMCSKASDEISHASDKVTGEIRSNPIRSSMIALGMGVLIGVLIRR